MKNAETPVMKVTLFGAISSFGSALMAEMLRRQHEVIAIVDDLNALAPRPGLRTKTGNLFDSQRVSESIAGCSAVVCLLDAKVLPVGAEHTRAPIGLTPEEQLIATHTLLRCLRTAQIRRLILVADIQLLHNQPLADYQDPDLDQHQASALIVDALRKSDADWTLVSAPQGVAGLSIEHFSHTSSIVEPGLEIPLEVLGRVASGIADELKLNMHVRQYVNFVV
ncbi:NAD(P)H-binding protein [Pseudomonas abietaniphila]|uniref:NAD(P)-dependent oxidoreductase n=1 Tax=Pseudomonas abietaniphila TaxID=89065 RepID=UPI0032167A6A